MATIVWDDGGGDSLASTGDNWVGDVAPGTADVASYDATAVTDCTWDIAQVTSILIDVLYTGDITQSALLYCTSDFTMVTNATSSWTTGAFDLEVDGNWAVSGAGIGVTHTSSGVIYIGGNVTVTNSVLDRYDSLVVIRHSQATPTTAKSHDIDVNVAASRMNDVQFSANQTWKLINGFNTEVVTFDGSNVMDDDAGGPYVVVIADTWVTPGNSTYVGSSEDHIELNFSATSVNPVGADYGNCMLRFSDGINGATIAGTWATSGTVFMRTSAAGTTAFVLDTSASLTTGDVQIGNESQTARSSSFTQNSGSTLTVNGDVLIVEDDNITTNIWTRLAGVLDTIITGNLTVETEAELAWTNDTSNVTVQGNTSISATAVVASGSVTWGFTGSGVQTLDLGAKTIFDFFANKSGGSLTSSTIVKITETLRAHATGDYNLSMPVALAHTCKQIYTTGTPAGKVSIISGTPATKFDLAVTLNGRINRYSGWKDSNITGAIVRVDTVTGSDDLNNTLAGANGLLFQKFAIVKSSGLGMGTGLGLGTTIRN